MIARMIVTLILLLLSLYAFCAGVLDGGHILNPSGIAFLVVAGLVWFGWDTICAAFVAAKDESNIPIIRLGATIVRGMTRQSQRHSKSDEPAA